MITHEDYELWLTHHRDLFRMHTEEDLAMFAAWWPLLKTYTLVELNEATDWLALRDVKMYRRDEQLGELRRRIAQRRFERLRAEAEQQQEGFIECSLCSGTGVVIVPHPRYVINDQWMPNGNSYPTCGVLCQCTRGVKRYEAAKYYALENNGKRKDGVPVKVSMTLQEYETKNPEWFHQIAERNKSLMAEGQARMASERAQAAHGGLDAKEVRNRLAANWEAKKG